MWEKIKGFFSDLVKPVSDYLTAHPKFKNILASLEKAVLASVVAYFATVLKSIMDSLSSGAPIQFPQNYHLLLVGIGGGLWIAVSGAIRAWAQNNHDTVLAVVQDNVMAGHLDVPVATSSILTPLDQAPEPLQMTAPRASVPVTVPTPTKVDPPAQRPVLKAGYKPILRIDDPKKK